MDSPHEIGQLIGMILRWRMSQEQEEKTKDVVEYIEGVAEGILAGLGGPSA